MNSEPGHYLSFEKSISWKKHDRIKNIPPNKDKYKSGRNDTDVSERCIPFHPTPHAIQNSKQNL